jgi:transposase InsO family protein/transposase-like protein
MPSAHPPEFRRRAVELAREVDENGNRKHPIAPLARDLKISESCLRNWLADDEIEHGERPGLTRAEREELVRLRRENRVLRIERDLLSRAAAFFAQENAPSMIFAFIEAEKANFPIRFMCQRLGVSSAGFYEWRRAQADPCRRRREDGELTDRIREIHQMSRCSYGSPRIHAELVLGDGRRVGRKRIERLMRAHGIVGIHRRRRGCTRRNPEATPADDLVDRHFDPDEPDRLWVADVTEHPTGDGKVYLAVVLDAFSRIVSGWSIASHMRTELVVDALQMAIWRRRPPAGQTVHHSDHGSQPPNTPHGRSGGGSAPPGCSAPWAPSATPWTTPSPRASSALCRSSCSTSTVGTAELSWRQPSSNGSRPGHNPHRRHSYCGLLSPADYEASHRAKDAT